MRKKFTVIEDDYKFFAMYHFKRTISKNTINKDWSKTNNEFELLKFTVNAVSRNKTLLGWVEQ